MKEGTNTMNKVILIGRLTKDVELRYTPAGHATSTFTVAVDRSMKSVNGEKQTDFIQVSIPPYHEKLAELCSKYLSKGKLASVEGSIQTRTYTDKDGTKRYITEVIGDTVQFLSPKSMDPTSIYTETLGTEVNTATPFDKPVTKGSAAK